MTYDNSPRGEQPHLESRGFSSAEAEFIANSLDPEFRAEMETDVRAAMSSKGVDIPAGVDVQLHMDTDETFHLVFPPDPNAALSDESLGVVSGGGKSASSAGSVSSASTVSCLPSTASTGGSAGTVSSGGSGASD